MIGSKTLPLNGILPLNRLEIGEEFRDVRLVQEELGEKAGLEQCWESLREVAPTLEPSADQVTLSYQKDEYRTALQLSGQKNTETGTLTVDRVVAKNHGTSSPDDSLFVKYQTKDLRASSWPAFLQMGWTEQSDLSPQEHIERVESHYGLDCEVEEARVFLNQDRGHRSLIVDWTGRDASGDQFHFRSWSKDKHRALAKQTPPPAMLPWNISWHSLKQTAPDSPIRLQDMEAGKSSSGTYDVKAKFETREGEHVGRFDRSFLEEDGKRIVYHQSVSVDEKFQGKGVSKALLRDAFKLYDDHEIDSVRLSAGASVGGYAWAKFGWELWTDEAPKSLGVHLEKRLDELQLPNVDRALVEKLANIKHPKMIWALADLEQPVMFRGKSISLGKALLLGSGWEARMSTQDEAARERLDDYLALP